MKLRGSWIVLALVAGFACTTMTAACDGLMSSSKVAQGQRYQADDQKYDPYFDSVHQYQVRVAAWPNEKQATRKPLITLLALTLSASDDTILSATRSRAKKLGPAGAKLDVASAHVTSAHGASDAPLFFAVEETVRLELDRAHKLKEKGDRLEEMAKRGEELKKILNKEIENGGAEKTTEKRHEIRRELSGAIKSMRTSSNDAQKGTRDTVDFFDDLAAAIEAQDAPPRKHVGPDKPLPAKPPEAMKEEPKKPAKPEAKKPGPKPKAPPPPGEVFNP